MTSKLRVTMKAGPRGPAGIRMAVFSPGLRPELASARPSTATTPRSAHSRERPLVLAPGQRSVEAGGQAYLDAPRQAALPAAAPEEVGGRGQGVAAVVDQVAAAVAVEIDRQALVGGGHELGVAESAGPRTVEALGGDVAALEDAQGGEELALEVTLAAPEAGQRAECLDQRVFADDAPEIAFDAPDGHHRRRIDPVGSFDALEDRGMLGQVGLAVGDALVVDEARQVIPDRQPEFRLVVELFDDREVGLGAARVSLVAGWLDA